MRLDCIKTKAKFVPVDTFIYLPQTKTFFFVDDIDHDDTKVIFYFEEGLSKSGGIIEKKLSLNENEEVMVVCQYEVTKDELLSEIKEKEADLLEIESED